MNLERRIKKTVHGSLHNAMVRHPKGMTDICKTELERILSSPLQPDKSSPVVTHDEGQLLLQGLSFRRLMEVVYRTTTSRDILWILGERKVSSKAEVYRLIDRLPLDLILARGTALSLRVHSTGSRLYHQHRLRDLVIEALVAAGYMPVGRDEAPHLLELRIREDRARAAMSLGGRPLYMRGYKKKLSGRASVKEDLAAAATNLSLGLWRTPPTQVLIPYAGSGTLGFEAVLAMNRIAPCLLGRRFGLDEFLCTPADTSTHLRKAAARRCVNHLTELIFIDSDSAQCDVLRENFHCFEKSLRAAGLPVPSWTVLEDDAQRAFSALTATPRFMPLNPPYGRRLGISKAVKIYRDLGRETQRAWAAQAGGYVFSPDETTCNTFKKHIKDRDTNEREVSHGGLRVKITAFGPSSR